MDDLMTSFFEITKKVRKSFSPVKPDSAIRRNSKLSNSKPAAYKSKSSGPGLLDVNTSISDATEEVGCFGNGNNKQEKMQSSFEDDSFYDGPGVDDVVYEVEIEADNENEEGQINTSHETVDDDEDIYGDLESSIFTSKKPSDDNGSQVKLEELQKERDDLKRENRRIARLNKTYATNISSLYKTAKNEIDKKNFIIKQLQTRLRDVTATKAQGSSMSKEEIKEILSQCQEANQEAHSQVIIKEIQKSIELMKASRASKKKKFYKFGNMSLYFHKEQIQFKRSEMVNFPLVEAVTGKDTTSPSLNNSGLDVSKSNSSIEQLDNRSGSSKNCKIKDEPTRNESHRSRSRSSDRKGHRSPIRSSARVYDLRNDKSPPGKRWNHYKSRHERREDLPDRKRKYSPEQERLRGSTNHRNSRSEISSSNKRSRNRR